MKSIAVLLVAVVAVQGSLLGARKCTYGPSYWCASLENAKECSASEHCMKVWTAKKSPVDAMKDTTMCTYCKDMVTDVKNFIADNKTREQILDYVKSACDFMPDDFAQGECQKIAEHYLDEFIDLIKNQVDAQQICELLHLCGNSKAATKKMTFKKAALHMVHLKPAVTDSTLCDECKTAVAMAKTEIDDKDNQAALKKLLEGECQRLGADLSAECQTVVDMMLPEVIAVLDKYLNDDLCTLLEMCTSSAMPVDIMAKAKATFVELLKRSNFKQHIIGVASRTNSESCTVCEEVVNYIKLFVKNNETEQEVMSLLENEVCSQLGAFSSMCKEVVEQYFPNVWNEFMAVLDPKTLCTEIGLCNGTSTVSAVRVFAPKPKKESVGSSIQCVICEFVIEKVESTLSDNATEDEIIKTIEKVCSLLPSSFRTECDQFIEQYGKEIIRLLVSDVPPSTVCTVLGLCSGHADVSSQKVGDEACMFCELGVNYAKKALANNATQEKVLAQMEKFCGQLAELKSMCVKMVDEYGPVILKKMAAGMDAKKLCSDLGLCSSSKLGKADGLIHLYKKNRFSNI